MIAARSQALGTVAPVVKRGWMEQLSARLRLRQRDAAVVLGLLLVVGLTTFDLLLSDGRAIPLTTVLLAPLIASAAAGPRLVAALGVAAVAFGVVLGRNDSLDPSELYSRVTLVAVASLLSVFVSANRTSRERALERADRVEDLSVALQYGLSPTFTPGPRVRITPVYQPGVHDLLLGGDFLDVITLPDGSTAFCVGDVAGHAPDSAALGAALRTTWRALALGDCRPLCWVEGLDRLLCYEVGDGERFATLLVGRVSPDGHHLQITSAGHHAPFLRAEAGPRARLLDLADAAPLGLGLGLGGWVVEERSFDEPWELVCYTDGLIEGRAHPGSSERYGARRLAADLDALPDPLDDAAVHSLIASAVEANGGDLEDDVAVLSLYVTPE